jgi:hypothetical protein
MNGQKHLYWDHEAAKERFIYLWGKNGDGSYVLWEIQTNKEGKFYSQIRRIGTGPSNAPAATDFEEVVPVPGQDDNNNNIQYFVMLSEFRLSEKRLFDTNEGIIKQPEKRCANIDDISQTVRNVERSGTDEIENVGVLNHIREGIRRNRVFQNRFNNYLSSRYDLTVRAPFSEDTVIANETFKESDVKETAQQRYERLKRLSASLVLQCITKEKKVVGTNGDGSAREEIVFNEELKGRYLYESGRYFVNYIQTRLQDELTQFHAARRAVEQIWEWIKADGFCQTLIDYIQTAELDNAADPLIEKMNEGYASILERVDEFIPGKELILKMFNGNDLLISQKKGLITNGKLVQKHSKWYIKLVKAVAKAVTETKEIPLLVKERLIENLFKKALGLELKRTLEIIETKKYISNFEKAKLGAKINFNRYLIDPESLAIYEQQKNLKDALDDLGCVVDVFSLTMNIYEWSSGGKFQKEGYATLKDAMAIIVYIGKKYQNTKKFATGVGYISSGITSSIDSVISGIQTYKEFKENDTDAAFFKAGETVGSALLAASSICYLVGASSSATGVGVPIGAPLLVVGVTLNVAGGIGYWFVNDTPQSTFLEESLWGNKMLFNQSAMVVESRAQKLLEFVNGKNK